MSPTVIVIIVVGAILLYAVVIFNRFVALRARAQNAWSDIDVQLKRRWDLVPRLVETVRGYAAHEAGTLEATVAARGRAQAAGGDIAQRSAAESELGGSVGRLIALSEAYPNLKADELFRTLQLNLVEVEDHLQAARRYYNAVVRDLNTAIAQFPASIIAGITGAKPRQFFQLESQSEAVVPQVQLGVRGDSATDQH